MNAPSASPVPFSRTLPPRALALQLALCALWGLTQIATKLGNAGISPVWHAGLRSVGATLLLLAWIAWRRLPAWRADGTLGAGLLVGLLFALEFLFLYSGLNHTTAARATLILYSAPLFVALGAHWLVPGERLRPVRVAGLAAAFGGLVLAFSDRLGSTDANGLLGDAACLLAAVGWAGTTLAVKAGPLRRALPEKTLLYQLGVSAPVLLGASLLLGEAGVFAPTPLVWTMLAWQTVVVAFASYLLWFGLVSRHSATTLHALTFLTPLFGVFFAWLLLDETVTPMLFGALFLVACGIVLVNRP